MSLEAWQPPELAEPIDNSKNPIDARGADWSGKIIAAINLQGARLSRADLRGTDLSNCNLENADLKLAKYNRQTRWALEQNLMQCFYPVPTCATWT